MRILPLLLLAYSAFSFGQTVEELTQSAQNNNVHAQLELAERYRQGDGVELSDSEAFYWYQQAAENGNQSAAIHLGQAYLKGKGTKVDIENAIFWLNKAALSDDAQAALLLGQLYESLKQQPSNLDLAELWYQEAAKNDPQAEDDYARILEQQFNARRAKQVAAIDQLEVAFDHQQIELSPKAKSVSRSQQAGNNTIYALVGLLLASIAVVIWLLKTNNALRQAANTSDSNTQRQHVKLERELKRKDDTLKQQKRQMEAMYRHIKKQQAAPKQAVKENPKEKPLTLACALFGYSPTKIPPEKQVKLRYKQLCKIYHPDLKGSEEEMKRLNQALKVILAHVNK